MKRISHFLYGTPKKYGLVYNNYDDNFSFWRKFLFDPKIIGNIFLIKFAMKSRKRSINYSLWYTS